MKMDDKAKDAIEAGKQLGDQISFKVGSDTVRLGFAIQKVVEKYVAHIHWVNESNISLDDYDHEETKVVDTLEEAISFLKEASPTDLSSCKFAGFKGQRIFWP